MIVRRSHSNKRFFENNMNRLTPNNIAELVNRTSSKVSTSEENKPDLSFETAKLAILRLYDRIENEFPFKFNKESIEIDDVVIDCSEVQITWRFTGGTLPIGNDLSIDEYLQYTAKSAEKNDILEVIKNLVDEFDNYIPLYEIRNRLTHLSREEQDDAINELSRTDVIELSKLSEPWFYTEEQRSAGIPTPIAGDLFFVILN